MRMSFGLILLALAAALVSLINRFIPKARDPDAAFSFDLSLAAERYRHHSGLDPETVQRHETEFRRFFSLIARHPHRSFGLNSQPVDEFWHQLICCTALYRDYCLATVGRFVDHDPRGGSEDAFLRTWVAYYASFGETPDPAIWPSMEAALERRRVAAGHDGDSGDFNFDGGGFCHDGGGHASCSGHGCASACGSGCGGD